jgi:hypothetical protein
MKTYSFQTNDNFRIDVKASTPNSAYNKLKAIPNYANKINKNYGTEMIDNSPNEKAGELAEAIYDDVLFILDIEHKCIQEDEDGNTSDITEYGQQDLFNGIYEQCMELL